MITRTEATTGTQFRTKAWGVFRKPGPRARGDVTVEHHRTPWKRLAGYAVRLSSKRYLGGKKECWAAVTVYRLRGSDRTRVVVGVHMPARVEGPLLRGTNTVDTNAWTDALAQLGRLVAELREKCPHAEIVVVGDWNVNLRNKHFRDLIARQLRLTAAAPVNSNGKRIPWSRVRGTHGGRVIDWAFTNRHTTVKVLPSNAASDHRPIDITIHPRKEAA
ncbi:endonuclease/exonuclease/phosphatase family protein [Nocardioides jensenii]|uniref:endonuclease/exonuclease/phosphatase family protein n=1 Tax=Nocardioides jensenii TaxID=1843 RepID=UPI00082ABEE9|nr:endonuclease/exonuclease/phosphatase family protein [Nocardioides jensenii]